MKDGTIKYKKLEESTMDFSNFLEVRFHIEPNLFHDLFVLV